MYDYLNIRSNPVRAVLPVLLRDKTTGRNIVWGTDSYAGLNQACQANAEITEDALLTLDAFELQPRCMKAKEEQLSRTRSKAEVFTPSWICNRMNNVCDEDWFGVKVVFNRSDGQTWISVTDPAPFPEGKDWKQYVDSRRLEITCGEAPFIASRYDTSTGDLIPIPMRIGILDRKLRVVRENVRAPEDWYTWARHAVESVYGYEYQGDNLLIARINVLMTWVEHSRLVLNGEPDASELRKIANVVSWNFWQMDGLTGMVPFAMIEAGVKETEQLSFLGMLFNDEPDPEKEMVPTPCKIYDWRARTPLLYNDMKEATRPMKFDYVIGNPPYQDETLGENETFAPQVYHLFMDAAYDVADTVELIHPARFLFNAGSTPKAWNKKMLDDEHFKVLKYWPNEREVFPGQTINGGVAITYRDHHKTFGAIEIFTAYPLLNEILHRVKNADGFRSFSEIVVTRTAYRLTDKMHRDHPEAISQLSDGHAYDMSTNIFDRLPQVFFAQKPDDRFEYIRVLGRTNNERVSKWIRRDYVNTVVNLDKYKVVISAADGASGTIGKPIPARVVGAPSVAFPGQGSTESFSSIGCFDTEEEAQNLLKYIKSKFARTLLAVLKVTQHITPEKWKYVPLQDFTPASDIDWTQPIQQIDRQLYRKYGLTDEEIAFIESHVKEMT